MDQLLKIIADNPSLTEALKKTFFDKFDEDKVNNGMSNELIGQITRSRIEGLRKIDEVFKVIEHYKSEVDKPSKTMQGR